MEQVAYRVVDAVCDNRVQRCIVYCRDVAGRRATFAIPAVYEIVVGSDDSKCNVPDTLTQCCRRNLASQLRIAPMGQCLTYYRGRVPLFKVTCPTYAVYTRVLDNIRYGTKGLYLCNSSLSLEDLSMLAAGIYATLYVVLEGPSRRLRPAPEALHFAYTPIVAAFDLEMLSLDPYDPKCEVYLVGYVVGDKRYVIYTRRYVEQRLPRDEDIEYVRVDSRTDAAKCLAALIHETKPDVLTGYNVYNADVPMVYTMLRRELARWPAAPGEPDPWFQYTRRIQRGYANSERGLAIKVPGTHCIDMYGYLEATLPKEDKSGMKLDEVGARYLGETKHPMGHKELARIYHYGTVDERLRAMRYCVQDCNLAAKLYHRFNVWNAHSSMYALSGVDPQRNVTNGDVVRTYGMCTMYARGAGLYMDAPRNKVYRPSGGLVLTPRAGEYRDIACVDVTSLYPNIVIAHNIDAMTAEPWDPATHADEPLDTREYYAQDASERDILRTHAGNAYAFRNDAASKQHSMLPSILWALLRMRDAVKAQLAGELSELDRRVLDARQLALKILANAVCGTLGEATPGNPMSYCALNDVITTTGRSILSLAIGVAQHMGLRVVYGDTDSLFIEHHGKVQEYLDRVHSHLPHRIRFKVEYIAPRFLVGKKKHYVALLPSGKVHVMGYKAVGSSRCVAAKRVFRWLLDVLLESDKETMLQCYMEQVGVYFEVEQLDASAFSIAYKVTGAEYRTETYQARLNRELLSRGIALAPGNNVDLVRVLSEPEYVSLRGRRPPISLPGAKVHRSKYMYTLDEVEGHEDVVDVRSILEEQCLRDLRRVVDIQSKDLRGNDDDADSSDDDDA